MEVALGYYEDSEDERYDITTTRPPASGIEYLKQVQHEASQQPEVVAAPYKQVERSNTDREHTLTSSHPTAREKIIAKDERYLPNEITQARAASDFANLRQAFVRYRIKHKKIIRKSGETQIPVKQDIGSWCKFCFGDNFLNPSNENLDNEDGSKVQSSVGHPPLLGLLCQISQPITIQLLEYHLVWFNRKGFTREQGRWLYALLLCLDKPTPPDALSCLRNISRVFSRLRMKAAAEDDVEVLFQLYFFVIIICKCFSQCDLALRENEM